MKLFKKLAGACLALTFCFGMVGLVACGGKGDNGGDGSQANAYNFMVYTADQQPAAGYYVQMCTTDSSGTCYNPVAIGADGKVSITKNEASCPAEAVYEVHILDNTYTPMETTETVYTPATFSTEYIVITLA